MTQRSVFKSYRIIYTKNGIMRAILENDKIVVEDPTDAFKKQIRDVLSYIDSSKEYQIRKMERNPFTRNSAFLKKLKKEVSGCLVIELPNGSLQIPSGFAHLVSALSIEDRRADTGKVIALPWVKTPHACRDYQDEAVSLMLVNYRGLVCLGTGLGKTLTAVHAIRKIKKRTLIVCPGKAIADNFYSELVGAFGESKVGYFGGGKKQIKDITVGIAASVNNSLDKFVAHDLGLVITDEVHHLAADTFFAISTALSSVGRMYGLTATDYRSDGKDILITAGVGDVLIRRDLVWGIQNSWLADPFFIVRSVDTIGKEYQGDKLKNYKSHVLESKEMNDQIIGDVNKFIGANKSVLCLVDQVEHGRMIAAATGLPFATGEDKQSKEYIKQLNAGTIPGLIGTAAYIGEGCDTKNVDVLVLANFTATKGKLIQNLGRGMRLHGTKTHVIVLDYMPASKMLKRHAKERIKLYEEITNNVKVI